MTDVTESHHKTVKGCLALQYSPAQEEADGCLLLHAAHAARKRYQSVEICSKDKDVFVMSLAFCDKIEDKAFQKCGTRTHTRLVVIRKIAATVGFQVCKALIGLHLSTGRDIVSAFGGTCPETSDK